MAFAEEGRKDERPTPDKPKEGQDISLRADNIGVGVNWKITKIAGVKTQWGIPHHRH